MNENTNTELKAIFKRYMQDDGEVADELKAASMVTLRHLHQYLSEAVGYTGDVPKTHDDRSKEIITLLDTLEANPDNRMSSVLSEIIEVKEQGGSVTSHSSEAYSNRKDSGMIPRTKKDYLTPYSLLRANSVPPTPENQEKIVNHCGERLLQPENWISTNDGKLVNPAEAFIFGKKSIHSGNKQASSQTALYINPRTSESIFTALELVPVLPDDKTHWLSTSNVTVEIGTHTQKRESVESILLEMKGDGNKLVFVENEAGEKSQRLSEDVIKKYHNSGGNSMPLLYSDPDFIRAEKDNIYRQVQMLNNPDHNMMSVFDLTKEIGANNKTLDTNALKFVLGNLRNDSPDREVKLTTKGGDSNEYARLDEVIRETSWGVPESTLQMDKRAVPALADDIKKDFDKKRFPTKDWLPPLEFKNQLQGAVKGVTNRNIRQVLHSVIQNFGDEPLGDVDKEQTVRDAFYVFGGPKGDAMKVDPSKIDVLKPFVSDAVELVKNRPIQR